MSFSQVYPCRRKLYANDRFLFLRILLFIGGYTRYMVSREGRVTDQSRCVSRIHYVASHHSFFPSLYNLIKLTVTHLARVSHFNFSFAPALLNFLTRVTIYFVLCIATLSCENASFLSSTFEGQTISAVMAHTTNFLTDSHWSGNIWLREDTRSLTSCSIWNKRTSVFAIRQNRYTFKQRQIIMLILP